RRAAASRELVEEAEAVEAAFPLRATQRSETGNEGERRSAGLNRGDRGHGERGRVGDDVEEDPGEVPLERREIRSVPVEAVARGGSRPQRLQLAEVVVADAERIQAQVGARLAAEVRRERTGR